MTLGIRTGARSRPIHGRSRLPMILGLLAITASVIIVLAIVLAIRYLPSWQQARELRESVRGAVGRLTEAGLDVDAATIAEVRVEIERARASVDDLGGMLRSDPLIRLFRGAPWAGEQIAGADDLVSSASDVVLAAQGLLGVIDELIVLRGDGFDGDVMAAVTGFAVEARPEVAAATALLVLASEKLDRIPNGLVPPIIEARDELRSRLDDVLPRLSSVVSAGDHLPDLVGATAPRRYLVLALDPAELRPPGGFAGTYGVVEFDGGAIVGRDFDDVYHLDLKPDLPYVEPPPELRGHLLGQFSWQLADAAWAIDFPAAARKSLELYTLESGDSRIDGVIALNTYAIDEILSVTGPVEVAEYDVTVPSGQTTIIALEKTRRSQLRGENRKDFLDTFAAKLIDELRALPLARWPELQVAMDRIRVGRQALVWMVDPAEQAHIVEAGWDGGIRQDPGDFVMAVDSNVAPVGKLNLVVERSLELSVELDEMGNARNTVTVAWHNPIIEGQGGVFPSLRTIQAGREIYGVFFRLVTPQRSRFVSASGGTVAPITALETETTESGRTVFGNYTMVPPGDVSLTYEWISPYASEVAGGEGVYRLTVQKQPGTRTDEVSLRIAVPDGYMIRDSSEALIASGRELRWSGTLDADLEFSVIYARSLAP